MPDPTTLSPEIAATVRAFLENIEDFSAQILIPANCVGVVRKADALIGVTPTGKVVASTKRLARYLAENL